MASDANEDELLRSVTLQNSRSILAARQRAEAELRHAKDELERKTAELAQSLAMMRATLESSTDGILVTDFDGTITSVNQNFVTMWQMPPAVMDARDHRRLLEISSRQLREPEGFRHRIEEIYATALPETYDLLELVDGRVLERFTRIQFVDGRDVGRVWTFRDITDRRNAEAALLERARLASLRAEIAGVLAASDDSQAMLQRCCEILVHHLSVAFARIWTLDGANQMLELQASAGLYTHLDGPHSRIPVGQLKIGTIAQECRPHLTNDAPDDPRVSDHDWARRMGMVAFAGYPLMVERRCVGVLAVFARQRLSEDVLNDLSPLADSIAQCIERRQTEAALRTSEARKAAVLATALDSVITCDATGAVLEFNPAAEQTFGIPRADALGRDLADLIIPPRLRAEHRAGMARYLAGGASHVLNRRIEMSAVRSDGTEFPVELAITRIPDAEPAVFTGYIRDITSRKQAEEALRKQTEWLRITLTSIADAVITSDRAGSVTSLNTVAEAMTGWTEQDACGQPLDQVLRLVREDDRGALESPAARALREGRNVGPVGHAVLIARDGTERAIDTSAAPIRDDDGAAIGAVLILRDITERRRAEERLRHSAAQFRQLADALPQIVWTARPDGFVDYYNARWYEFSGFEPGDEANPGWRAILHPDDVDRYLATYHDCIRSGRLYEIEHRFRDLQTGGYRWFLSRAYPVADEHGRVLRWFGTSTDIHATKQAEETTRFLADAGAALAELTDYESTLKRVAGLAVPFFADWCAVDMREDDGTIRRLAVTHTDPAKVSLAHDLFRKYPPRPTDPHGIMNVLRTGKPDWVASIPDSLLAASAQDDEHLQIMRSLGLQSFVCVPLTSRSKVLGGITFVTAESGRVYDGDDVRAAQDLAQRTVIAIENAGLIAALKDSDRRKDEFLAMLAHELRNPLAPVRSAVQVIRAKAPPIPELDWARDVIDRQVDHLTRLVDDLLDVSRITRGQIQLRKRRVELTTVIEGAVEGSRPLLEEGGHQLQLTLPSEPIWLTVDPVRMTQAVLNLLTNAAKYTEDEGHISLSAELVGDEVAIRVEDDGVGIPGDMLPHVFELFTQVDRTLNRSQGGLGIGLTLVQRLTEMHGGKVEAHSAGPGQGSQFVIRLPVASRPVTPARAEPAPAPQPGPTVRPHRILVVDDNEDSADGLALLLGMQGHEVRLAHDGLQAVAAAAEFRPSVVLLDIGLPKLDGHEAARQIRAQPGGDRRLLIALTGWGQAEARRRSREAGFDHHLTKPVQFDAVRELIDHAPEPGDDPGTA